VTGTLRYMIRSSLILAVPLALSACLPAPDLPPRRDAGSAPAPALLPTAGLLRRAEAGPTADTGDTAAPPARAAALRARAARLRGPVVAPAQRARLLASEGRLRRP